MSWQERAACRGMNPDLFFNELGASGHYTQARAVCAGCDVRGDCLNQALVDGEDYGLWGGLTARERDQISPLRRSANGLGSTRFPAACGTEGGYARHRSHGEDACQACKDATAIAKKARKQRLRMEVA